MNIDRIQVDMKVRWPTVPTHRKNIVHRQVEDRKKTEREKRTEIRLILTRTGFEDCDVKSNETICESDESMN